MSIASAVNSLYASPTGDTSRRMEPVVNPPPPYIPGSQPAFPGDTESEKSTTRLHELAQPPPVPTPSPAYNNSVGNNEGYIPYCPGRPGPEVAGRDAARPRSEPRVLLRIRCEGKRQRPPRLYPSRQYKTLSSQPQLFRYQSVLQISRPLHEYLVCHTRSLLWMLSRL